MCQRNFRLDWRTDRAERYHSHTPSLVVVCAGGMRAIHRPPCTLTPALTLTHVRVRAEVSLLPSKCPGETLCQAPSPSSDDTSVKSPRGRSRLCRPAPPASELNVAGQDSDLKHIGSTAGTGAGLAADSRFDVGRPARGRSMRGDQPAHRGCGATTSHSSSEGRRAGLAELSAKARAG